MHFSGDQETLETQPDDHENHHKIPPPPTQRMSCNICDTSQSLPSPDKAPQPSLSTRACIPSTQLPPSIHNHTLNWLKLRGKDRYRLLYTATVGLGKEGPTKHCTP